MAASGEVCAEYESSLRDLTFNSKPHISMLTMLAEENVQNAPQIVKVIEAHLHRVKPECKLPTMYLIDSIVKNVGHAYSSLFVQNLVSTFCGVFEKVDEKVRMQLFKLRQTWADIFPNKKLYAIDMRVKQLDPAWPITAQPPQQQSIHVNPKFLKPTVEEQQPPNSHEVASRKLQDLQEEEMRKQLLAKQQELLRLQRQKLELELIQTQVMVEEQKRQLFIKEQQVLRVQQQAQAEVQKVLQNQQQQNLSAAVALVAKVAQGKVDNSHLTKDLQVQGTSLDHTKSINIGGSSELRPIMSDTGVTMQLSSRMTNKLHPIQILSKNKLPINSNSVNKTERIGDATNKKSSPSKSDLAAAAAAAAAAIIISNVDPNKRIVSKLDRQVPNSKETVADALSCDSVNKIGSQSLFKSKSNDSRKHHKKTPSPKKKRSDDKKLKLASSDKASTMSSESGNQKSSSSKKSSPSKGSFSLKGTAIERSTTLNRGHSRSPVNSGDKDERLTKRSRRSSPRKEKENNVSNRGGSSSEISLLHKTDIDLRESIGQDVSKRESGGPSMTDGEPPIKKSKSDESDLDDIFGGKDQDYRQLGRPVPRLSPIGEQSCWAQYKASRPEEFKNSLRSTDPFGFGNQDLDLRQEQHHHQQQAQHQSTRPHPWVRDTRLQSLMSVSRDPRISRRSSGGSGGDDDLFGPRMTLRPQQQIYQATQESDPNIPRALMFDRGSEIMRQADQQLRTGHLTIEQHAEIMEQLAKLYELQRMRHMQREQHVRDTVILNRKLSRSGDELSTGSKHSTSPEVSKENRVPLDENKISDDSSKKLNSDGMDVDISSVPLPSSSPSVSVNQNDERNSAVDFKKEEINNSKTDNVKEEIFEDKNDKDIEVIVLDDEPKTCERQRRRVLEQLADPGSLSSIEPKQEGQKRRESRWSSPVTCSVSNTTTSSLRQSMISKQPPHPVHHSTPTPLSTINTVMIDDRPREVRFIEGKAIVILENEDIREIGFRGPPQEVIFDKQVIRLCFANTIKDFEVDGMTHTIRFGAPTREVIVDGVPYAAVFGGPPILVNLCGTMHELRLSGPTPEVFFGDKPRLDLLPLLNMQPIQQHQLGHPPQRPDSPMGRFPGEFVGGNDSRDRDGPWQNTSAGSSGYMDEPGYRRGYPDWMRDDDYHKRQQQQHRRGNGNRSEMIRGRHLADDTNYYNEFEGRHSPFRGGDQQELLPSGGNFHPRFAHGGYHPNGGSVRGHHGHGPQIPSHRNLRPRHPTMVQYPIPYGYRNMGPPTHNEFGFSSNGPPCSRTPSMVPPPPMPVPPPSQINVSELFSKLVATGIIPQATKNAEQMDMQQSNKKQIAEGSDTNVADSTVVVAAEKIPPIELALESLRIRQPTVISALYCGIQCSSCGVRFTAEQTDKYAQHLDWHFRQNRREKGGPGAGNSGVGGGGSGGGGGGGGGGARKALLSRRWHYELQDWVQFEEFEDLEERARSFFELQASEEQGENIDGSLPSVVAGEGEEDKKCCVCQELFELYWDEEQEEWLFRDAIRHEEKNYHPLCYEDIKERPMVEECSDELVIDEVTEMEVEPAVEDLKNETKTDVDIPNFDKKDADSNQMDVKGDVDETGVTVKLKTEDVESESIDLPEFNVKEEILNESKIENTDNDESLSVFKVMGSNCTVPPGIGLEIELEPTSTETIPEKCKQEDEVENFIENKLEYAEEETLPVKSNDLVEASFENLSHIDHISIKPDSPCETELSPSVETEMNKESDDIVINQNNQDNDESDDTINDDVLSDPESALNEDNKHTDRESVIKEDVEPDSESAEIVPPSDMVAEKTDDINDEIISNKDIDDDDDDDDAAAQTVRLAIEFTENVPPTDPIHDDTDDIDDELNANQDINDNMETAKPDFESLPSSDTINDDNDDVDEELDANEHIDDDIPTVKFTVQPPVMRGTELSGLCSLM